MSNFLERLEKEDENLSNKIDRLVEFMNSSKFDDLDPFQQSVLMIQLQAMRTYSECLNQRLLELESRED